MRYPWDKDPATKSQPMMTEIQLIGIEDLNRRGRAMHPGIKVFGRRTVDTANRLVSVELSIRDAEPIIEGMAVGGVMPLIEVPNTSWAYVAVVGADEAKFKDPE